MRTRLGTALLAVTASLALAAPAHADQQVAKDATHDVVRGEDQKPARANKDADIITFTTRLNQDSVKLSTRLRALPKNDFAVLYQVKTAKSLYDVIVVGSGSERDVLLSKPNGQVRCPAKSTSTRKAQRTISVTIPRSCLDKPTAVQTGNAVVTDLYGDGNIDDARLKGRFHDDRLELGPKVRI